MKELGYTHRFEPGAPGDGRTLLLLHGTGGDEDDLLGLGRHLAPGAALLSPRGRVLERGMPRFFRRIAEGVFDLDDLRLQTGLLGEFVVEAAERYGLELARMVAVGYSNGANIAASLMLSRPEVLSRAVLLRAMVPFVPATPPELDGAAVLLAAGERDPIVPQSQTLALGEILRGAGARVTLAWHAGGHELGDDDVRAAREWLSRQPA